MTHSKSIRLVAMAIAGAMRMPHRLMIVIALFVLNSPYLVSQDQSQNKQLIIDLAKSTEPTMTVEPGNYQVILINALPGREYIVNTVNLGGSMVDLPPIKGNVNDQKVFMEETACSTWVKEVEKLWNSLRAESDEEAGVKHMDGLRALLYDFTCSKVDATKDIRDRITDVVKQGTRKGEVIEIKSNETIEITVTRTTGSKQWTRKIQTGKPGEFIAFYGLNVLFPFFERRFATRKNDTNALYVAQIDESFGDHPKYTPAVLFMYLPRSIARNGYAVTYGFGAGWNSEAPYVMIAGGLVFGWNCSVTIDAGIGVGRTLNKEKYVENQIVAEPLDWSQLSQASADGFVGVSLCLRLGANPYEGSE